MTTLVMRDILTNLLAEEPIPPEKIAYLQTRTRLRLHDFILRRFATAEDSPGRLDQAKLARRLGQSRARISQQLGVPGNWTIDSVTKLAAAIGGEIDFSWRPFPESASYEETLAAITSRMRGLSQHEPTFLKRQNDKQGEPAQPQIGATRVS